MMMIEKVQTRERVLLNVDSYSLIRTDCLINFLSLLFHFESSLALSVIWVKNRMIEWNFHSFWSRLLSGLGFQHQKTHLVFVSIICSSMFPSVMQLLLLTNSSILSYHHSRHLVETSILKRIKNRAQGHRALVRWFFLLPFFPFRLRKHGKNQHHHRDALDYHHFYYSCLCFWREENERYEVRKNIISSSVSVSYLWRTVCVCTSERRKSFSAGKNLIEIVSTLSVCIIVVVVFVRSPFLSSR